MKRREIVKVPGLRTKRKAKGTIEEIYVTVGDAVRKGDKLFDFLYASKPNECPLSAAASADYDGIIENILVKVGNPVRERDDPFN